MFDFLQLVRNENMKIYRRIRTWVMLGILLLVATAISSLMLAFETSLPSMWEVTILEANVLLGIVAIFTVVVSADSVAGEFSTGTIKLLLIRPWSRSKILLSKYIALLLFALFFAVVLLVYTFVLNWLSFGSDSGYVVDSSPETHPFVYLLKVYLYELGGLVMTVTLSFMISTVFRSGGLAIALAIFLLLGGSTLAGMFSLFDYEWTKYVLFMHMNLSQHLNGMPLIEGITLGFSLAVLAVYYVIFIALSWYVFEKRDVSS